MLITEETFNNMQTLIFQQEILIEQLKTQIESHKINLLLNEWGVAKLKQELNAQNDTQKEMYCGALTGKGSIMSDPPMTKEEIEDLVGEKIEDMGLEEHFEDNINGLKKEIAKEQCYCGSMPSGKMCRVCFDSMTKPY